MEMNIENMNLDDLISLREKLSDAIEKAKEEKYRDIKTGDVYTRSLDNGTKIVYLVLDEDENDSEYVDDELCAIVSVKYLCFFIDKNGFLISCGENSSERMDFVEYVHDADVKHECFDSYDYEDAVNKIQLDFYRKVNN